MQTNRHDQFISQLETQIATITEFNVLTQFDANKWDSYLFPYIYVDLGPDKIDYEFENGVDFSGVQSFILIMGLDTSTDGDIRSRFSTINLKVEKIFKNWKIDNLSTSDFNLNIFHTRVLEIEPIRNYGQTKEIYIIYGEIKYLQTWK